MLVAQRCTRPILKLLMAQRLTITVDSDVYEGLKRRVGEAGIGRFLNDLARSHVVPTDLEDGYTAMAADEAREATAEDWSEGLVGDVSTEPRRGR